MRTLTSATDGNWDDPRCWVEKKSGQHTVPDKTDTVIIGSHTIVMTAEEEVSGFHLTGGTLDLSMYNLTSQGESTWDDGVITGSGGFVNHGNLALTDRPIKTLQGFFNNFSTVTHVDGGALHIEYGSQWVNRPGSTYDMQSDADITGLRRWDSTPRFVNLGVFRKSGGSATSRVEVVFRNLNGTIEVDTGTLTLAGTGGSGSISSNGTFNIAGGAILDLGGGNVNVYNGSYDGNGEGAIQFNGGTLRTSTDFEPTTFRFKTGGFYWNGGTIEPLFNEFVNEGNLFIGGSSVKNVSAGPGVRNKGRVVHQGAGTLNLEYGGLWRNEPGSTYELQSDVGVSAFGGEGPAPVFENAGSFRKTGGEGIASINSDFVNNGEMEISAGMLNFSESFVQFGGLTRLNGGDLSSSSTMEIKGGELTGTGRILARVSSAGTVSPGSSPGTMDITGAYQQSADGTLRVEIGGLAVGQEYDQLLVRGQAHLGGVLEVVLLNGFVPPAGSAFQIVVSATRSGEFIRLDAPELPAGSAWKTEYLPKGVRLNVVAE